jgi:hypothetical protein
MTKIYLLVGLLLVVVMILKSPWFKGWLGELQINLITRFFLSEKIYHLIKNVTIPADGGTTQIDHVIVSIFGIFVVETKNMKGWIFGKEKDTYWTQKIFRQSHKFQNPFDRIINILRHCLKFWEYRMIKCDPLLFSQETAPSKRRCQRM